MFRQKLAGLLKQLTGMILSLLIVSSSISPAMAATVYQGGFDPLRPESWLQGGAPYSNNQFAYCSEGTFGPCSCGIHTLAYLLLKSEYWTDGKLATDAYNFSIQNNFGSNYHGGPAYRWSDLDSMTGNYLTYEGAYYINSYEEASALIRQEYARGNYVVISLAGNGGHLIMTDYVDEQGNIVVLDSGWRYKYLDDFRGMYSLQYLQVFSSPVDARQSAHFWRGERIGKVKHTNELNALKSEFAELERELQQEQKSENGTEVIDSVLTQINELAEERGNTDYVSPENALEDEDGFLVQDILAELTE